MNIRFLPSGKTTVATEDTNLLELAEKAGVLLDGSCAGKGTCGKCKVKVLEGKTAPPDEAEKRLLTETELADNYRLACRLHPQGELAVEVPGQHGSTSRKKDMMKLPQGFVWDILIKKVPVCCEKATLENQKSDLERIFQAAGLDAKAYTADPDLLRGLHRLLEKADGCLTLVLRGNHLIALEEGDTSRQCYGMAFDIGTTTVVSVLWDLAEKKALHVTARTNPQSVFGSDVISRIHYSNQAEENLQLMQQKIIGCFNDIIDECTAEAGIDLNHIYEMSVVGNTTMSHLFLGVDPAQMARTPFAPVFCSSVCEKADRLGVASNKKAEVYILPNIAGHVGSDIVGGMLASDLAALPGSSLMIDIGTNGEILLAKDGKIVACSTAAGPAFEGAAIYQGMRATTGAIEEVTIENGEVYLSVIDDEEPIGMCGSGLIDAIAQLLSAGIVDKTGRVLNAEAAAKKGVHPNLVSRLYEKEEGSGFVLFEGESGRQVVLTQKDIREVQLAKGAIAAGIKLMMKDLDLTAEDLDCVMIAGAFGNYVKKESALRIGLLPAVAEEKVKAIGNAAGTGSCMALLSEKMRRKAEKDAAGILHIELSTHPEFQDEYMMAMYFPKN